MKWKMVVRNVADAVDPPRSERHEMKTLTELELLRVFDALENPPKRVTEQGGLSSEESFRAAVWFAAYTGCRRGECLALRWDDVDLKVGTVSIRRAVQESKGRIYYKSPKNGKSRALQLSRSIIQVLQSHKVRQAAEQLAAEKYGDERFVFARPDGSVIRPQTFSQAFKALIDRAKVPTVRLHDLRHTHATLLLKGGVHPKIASSRLGHSNVGITLDLYSRVLPGMDRDAAQQFDALVEGYRDDSSKSGLLDAG